VGILVEFPGQIQKPAPESPAPEPIRSVSRSILICPCCERDILAERFSDGVLTLTPLDEVPDLPDPNDDGIPL
jgi:hypothetical protein